MPTSTLVNRLWPTALALICMLLACVAYFSPQLSGKTILSSDTVQNQNMSKELLDYQEATGNRSLWTNSMFGGMPAYQIYAPERGNLLRFVEKVLNLGFERPIGYFFTIMLGMFVLLRVLGVNVWLATIGAIGFGLGTNHITLFEAGHMTKVRAIAFMAPTLAGLILLFRGRYLLGSGLFALALGLNIGANHPQMTYYLAAACGVFVLVRLYTDLRSKLLARWATALGLALVCAVLALGASFSKISTTLEYGQDTMRGEPILTQEAAAPVTSSSQVKGLEWGYAMQWSNGLSDVLAGFVPGIAGSTGEPNLARDGALGTALRQEGKQMPPGLGRALYHGELPFTSGPVYFGSVFVYLFILSLFWLRPDWRFFFGASVLITVLISMGQHAEWLNRLLFNTVPYFNNFRAPSSATSVTALLIAAAGVCAVCSALLYRDRADRVNLRSFYLGTGVTVAILLGIYLLAPSLMDLMGGSDSQLEAAGFPMNAVVAERVDLLHSSALRSLLFVLATAGLVWAWLSQKLSPSLILAGLAILVVTDVWGVSRQYLGTDIWQSKRQVANVHAPRAVDERILQDPDPHYRVYDMSVNTFNDASPSYFHKNIGGYHAAKLQRAQDLIDRHISKGNPAVFDMLNTKYIISGEPGQEQVQTNPNAAGNAWFIKAIKLVPNANAELDGLTGLDIDSLAVVHQEFENQLPTKSFSGQGSIELKSYAPDRLVYTSNSDQAQFAVFSEMWYGPDKGWKASIDGQDVELIRANYALRALPIPTGQHEIVMSFEPASFYRGETISYIASALILLLGAAALFYAFRQNPPYSHELENSKTTKA